MQNRSKNLIEIMIDSRNYCSYIEKDMTHVRWIWFMIDEFGSPPSVKIDLIHLQKEVQMKSNDINIKVT